MKARNGQRDAVARASRVDHAVRRHQRVDSRFENPGHLPSSGRQLRPPFADPDNRVKAEAADGNIERRQRAEEMSAKTSVKMVPPLVFFIFPALMVVILGPAVLSLLRQLMPALQK